MQNSIEVFFDLGSPASYLAWTQLPDLAKRHNAKIVWRPILLGGIFKATGNQSPAAIPAKGHYMQLDLQRFADDYDVPMNFNPYFPINTLHLMRGAISYLDTPRFQAYLTAVFSALWIEELDMNQPEVVASVLSKAGFDPQEVLKNCNTEEIKEKLKSNTEEAIARGVFGAPTLFVDEQMFFGQDRLNVIDKILLNK